MTFAVGSLAHRVRASLLYDRPVDKPIGFRPELRGGQMHFFEFSSRSSAHKSGWWVSSEHHPDQSGGYSPMFPPTPSYSFVLSALRMVEGWMSVTDLQIYIRAIFKKDISRGTLMGSLSFLTTHKILLQKRDYHQLQGKRKVHFWRIKK